MSSPSPVPPAAVVDLAFGHSIAVTRTESGATLMIRAPGGLDDIEIEVALSSVGATLRKRTWSAPPAAGTSSAPPPAPMPPPAPPGAVVAQAFAPSREPHLSVQQYASLRAECLATDAEHLAEVRARYGLDEESDLVEAEVWGKKFAEDAGLFETYKHLFQKFRTGPPPRLPSVMPPGGASAIPSTAALARVLTLGEHATMAAELLYSPEEAVYAKYELSDRGVRAEVLRICELRLQDPNAMETWKKLHAIAVAGLEK